MTSLPFAETHGQTSISNRVSDLPGHPGGAALTICALQHSGLHSGARVLDLGCGNGGSVHLLDDLGFEAIGIDPRCQPGQRNGVTLVRACAESLPFPDHFADGILAECVLSVVGDLEAALAECARVLVPGGWLVLSDLYARNPVAIGSARALAHGRPAGMFVRHKLEHSLFTHGLLPSYWQDCSSDLASYTANFLMNHDSLDGLWCANGDACHARQTQAAMKAARAGYFLLTACKHASSGEADD